MLSTSLHSAEFAPTSGLRRFIVCALISLSACSGGGDTGSSTTSPPTVPATRAVPQSDQEIAQLLYTDSQRKPVGFYSEPSTDGLGAVATTHLKNTDVSNGATQFELCTDDWNQALAWSETTAQSSSPYGNLMATDDNARFFEFGRLVPTQPTLYVRSRVYKCAYLDRGAVNLQSSASSVSAGQLHAQPIDAAALKTFSEYLWQFTMYNNTGNAVLLSTGSQGAQSLSHTLYIGSLVRATSPNACDQVNVVTWKHSADVATGQVQLSVTPDFSFNARRVGGIVELCQ